MGKNYWVDWDDQSYPKIREIGKAPDGTTPMSLTQARREIIEHARSLREHWVLVIKATAGADAHDIHVRGDQY